MCIIKCSSAGNASDSNAQIDENFDSGNISEVNVKMEPIEEDGIIYIHDGSSEGPGKTHGIIPYCYGFDRKL